MRKGRPMYYLREKSTDHTGKYISVRDEHTLGIFLQKSYDEKVLKLIRQEIAVLEVMVIRGAGLPASIQNLICTFPQKERRLINAVDLPDDELIECWLRIPYKKKEVPGSLSKYISDNSDIVRSKTELNIANALYKRKIPYKYECPLILRNRNIIYPDFTILDVKNRKIVYWEHRGMMDDRDYAKNSVARLREYADNQIFPGDNLIITEETYTLQLGTNDIAKVIRHYFS